MDPLSIAASIIAIIQLSGKILGYLNDVKDSSAEHAKCMLEISNLQSLLIRLRFCLEDGDPDESWYMVVRELNEKDGPLDQFKQALEQLEARTSPGTGTRLQKTTSALVWKFQKGEVASILARIERLKSLVQIALEMDHL